MLYIIYYFYMEFIFAQILGAIALVVICVGYFVKQKPLFLILQIVGNIFYGGAFLILNSVSAGIITLISTIRCIYIFVAEKYNFKYTLYFLFIFIAAYICVGILFWQHWFDFIPIITATLFTIGYYVKNLNLMRYILLVPNAMLVFYCIMCKTYTSALLDFIEFSVIIVAIIKFKKEKNKTKTT